MNLDAPTVLSEVEVRRVLEATRGHQRDHALFRLALGTGLRVHELCALDVADLRGERHGSVAMAIYLRVAKGRTNRQAGRALVPERLRVWLGSWLRGRLGPTWDDSTIAARPLFEAPRYRHAQSTSTGKRLAVRSAQAIWARWQRRLGLVRPDGRPRYGFHVLRHTAITEVYERSRDLEVTRLFARHRDLRSTQRYMHAKPERLRESLPRW